MLAFRHAFRRDHPRIRGEHSLPAHADPRSAGSSPHTRGALDDVYSVFSVGRIIPAYAGSTRVETEGGQGMSDHPRIRGEHAGIVEAFLPVEGSSPHTRGAPEWRRLVAERCGIIPAYAGSTPPSSPRTRSTRDHPRIRGEHRPAPHSALSPLGSSPHTRGARRHRRAFPRP